MRYRLCLALGWPHPDYLLEFLTGEQYAGWIDYYSREPFGFPIHDATSAMTMSVIANSAGATPPTTHSTFSLAPREEANEDGSPTEDQLTLKLLEAFRHTTPGR